MIRSRTSVLASFGTKVLPVMLSVLIVFQLPGAQQTKSHSKIDPASEEFFERQVRPILANRCYPCHGPAAGQGQAGLRLDSLAGMLAGGRSGPVIVPGQPNRSLLVLAIKHDTFVQMPPKTKLPTREIQTLAGWVKMGAPWPSPRGPVPSEKLLLQQTGGPAAQKVEFTNEQESFWAFQQVVKGPIPKVRDRDWPQSPIDYFILAKLEARGLRPARQTDKRTLISRATIDLHGLLPTPEEVVAFLADDSPKAFARAIDRLLASPRYGERWARHWLDVARYADSNGMDDNLAYADAWRYRDYVITAFNKDKPYDQFVREQLAGDLLTAWGDENRDESLIATGFLVIGPKMLAEDDPVKQQLDIADEQLDTASRAFMGLTMGCARCHDHKFDPLPTADYYSLAAIFKSTKSMISFRVDSKWNATALGSLQKNQRLSALEKTIDLHDNILVNSNTEEMSADERKQHEQLLEKAKEEYAAIPKAMAVTEGEVQDMPLLLRGNHLTPGHMVPRRFPRILVGEKQTPIDKQESGRRELAAWLASSDHPLTARVMVNRIWKWHLGHGIVRSPDNFGRLGEPPDNQPLLDWLALQFVERGWSMKAMHRLIMLSSSYRMSTALDPHAAEIDPENRLLWRMNRVRMDAEVIRDSLLATSGQLDPTMGGSLLPYQSFVNLSDKGNARNPALYDSKRRSVYLPVLRSALFEVFQAFDFSDPAVINGRRSTTTVAPQALFMMNSQLIRESSNHLAEKLLSSPDKSNVERIARAYELVLSRPPAEAETQEWLEFLTEYAQAQSSQVAEPEVRRLRAWQGLGRVLLSSNEFVYVE